MATYYGFNTINQDKKFRLVDTELVKRDILNSLMIKQGEKPGNPTYGTSIWNIVFEPQTDSVMRDIEQELTRTVEQDPRVRLNRANIYPEENGVLIELEVTIIPTTEQQRLTLFFDQNSQTAEIR
jgi:phage baseplate assembly protein W